MSDPSKPSDRKPPSAPTRDERVAGYFFLFIVAIACFGALAKPVGDLIHELARLIAAQT